MWVRTRRRIFRSIRTSITRVLFSILLIPPVNHVARRVLESALPVLPKAFPGKFPIVGEVRVELPDSKMVRFATNGLDSIASRLYWSGLQGHEPETMAVFTRLVSRPQVFFDVGASTGLFALVAAAHNPETQVHAFEAVPEIYEFMVNNIALNGLSNLKAVQGCVTDYDGDATVYLNRTPALPFATSSLKGYRASGRSITTPALRLDGYVAQNGISAVDLIKLDTEATEDAALRGAADILRRFEPIIICEVLHRWPAEESLPGILEGPDLKSAGYRYFMITGAGLIPKSEIKGDPEYVFRNFLFVPESKLSATLDGVTVLEDRSRG